jgi:hypothetical protein
MSMHELTREHTTQQRQHDELRQESLLTRAEAELNSEESSPDEVREQVTEHRLQDENRHDNVLSRAEIQIDR